MAKTMLQAAQALYPSRGFDENTTREELFAAIIDCDEFLALWPGILNSIKEMPEGQELVSRAVARGLPAKEIRFNLLMMGMSAYMQAKLQMLREAAQA